MVTQSWCESTRWESPRSGRELSSTEPAASIEVATSVGDAFSRQPFAATADHIVEIERPRFAARAGCFGLAKFGSYFFHLTAILGEIGEQPIDWGLAPAAADPLSEIAIEELGVGE
jgi:hypothetical protein